MVSYRTLNLHWNFALRQINVVVYVAPSVAEMLVSYYEWRRFFVFLDRNSDYETQRRYQVDTLSMHSKVSSQCCKPTVA